MAAKKQQKMSVLKIMSIFATIALIIVAIFLFLSNRKEEVVEKDGQTVVVTPVQEVLSRNLSKDYPGTPKEVLKYYSEITRCFYSEDYSEEELSLLASKSRELFDDELLANQSEDDYLNSLKVDINQYAKDNMVISSYSVSNSTDVDYYHYEGFEWAQLYAVYSVRVATQITPVKEHFLLRKDATDHWKIVGWQSEKDE